MIEILTSASVPVIAAVVYVIVELIKYTTNNNEKVKRFIPLISAVLGVISGLVAFFVAPAVIPAENVVVAMLIGGASGLSATGFHQIIKQIKNKEV